MADKWQVLAIEDDTITGTAALAQVYLTEVYTPTPDIQIQISDCWGRDKNYSLFVVFYGDLTPI